MQGTRFVLVSRGGMLVGLESQEREASFGVVKEGPLAAASKSAAVGLFLSKVG